MVFEHLASFTSSLQYRELLLAAGAGGELVWMACVSPGEGRCPPQPLFARLHKACSPCLQRMTPEHEHLPYPGISSKDHELDFCSSFNLDEI